MKLSCLTSRPGVAGAFAVATVLLGACGDYSGLFHAEPEACFAFGSRVSLEGSEHHASHQLVADVDADGRDDVLLLFSGFSINYGVGTPTLTILRGVEGPGLEKDPAIDLSMVPSFSRLDPVEVRDVDSDQIADLIFDTGEFITVMYGPLSGASEVSTTAFPESRQGRFVDYDQDGNVDLVRPADDGVMLYRGGDAGFESLGVLEGTAGSCIDAVHVYEVGRRNWVGLEACSEEQDTQRYTVLELFADGGTQTLWTYNGEGSISELDDFSGDQAPEILVDGELIYSDEGAVELRDWPVVRGDIDGDGRRDTIYGSSDTIIEYGAADAETFGPYAHLLGIHPIATADLDGDNVDEILMWKKENLLGVDDDERLRIVVDWARCD